MQINDITYKIIGCAYEVYSKLGSGLLESTYEVCLEYELVKNGLKVQQQVALPVIFGGIKLEAGYRIDMLVEDYVIVELKSVDVLAPIHTVQVLAYFKRAGKKIGLLIDINVADLKKGIHRLIIYVFFLKRYL